MVVNGQKSNVHKNNTYTRKIEHNNRQIESFRDEWRLSLTSRNIPENSGEITLLTKINLFAWKKNQIT
jgi:hypothetical protein